MLLFSEVVLTDTMERRTAVFVSVWIASLCLIPYASAQGPGMNSTSLCNNKDAIVQMLQSINCSATDVIKDSALLSCGCETFIHLDSVSDVAQKIICEIDKITSINVPEMNMEGGLFSVPDQLLKAIEDMARSVMDGTFDVLCPKADELQQCLNTRFTSSQFDIDMMIRSFIDPTKIGGGINRLCGMRTALKDNLNCMFEGAIGSAMCAFTSGALNIRPSSPTGPEFVTDICSGINEMLDCEVVQMGACSQSLADDMKNMATSMMTTECSSARFQPQNMTAMANMYVYCALPSMTSDMIRFFNNTKQMTQQSLKSFISSLCGDELDRYFKCVNKYVPDSYRAIDRLFREMVTLTQLSKNNAVRQAMCTEKVINGISNLPWCSTIESEASPCFNPSTQPALVSVFTPHGLKTIPDNGEQIRNTYCSPLNTLKTCFVDGALKKCNSDLSETTNQMMLWIMRTECGGKPTESNFKNYVGDNGNTGTSLSPSVTLMFILMMFIIGKN